MINAHWLPFLGTAFACVVIVITRRWHIRFSADPTVGVQKFHTKQTPRIGGLAIMAGLFVSWLWAPTNVSAILGPMLIASIPAFCFGLFEDITKNIGVFARLLATMGSGLFAWYLTGFSMQNTGIAQVDWALQWLPLAVLLTAFAVGGVANAINIIDGFNGLASGSVAIMAGAIGLIALDVGDPTLASVCAVVVACAVGFGSVNWPMGRIFLGDGGAYLLGFCLAWLAVLLPMRNPTLNAWTTILVCAYPVLEVGFSVHRKTKRQGHSPGTPDKVHLHMLVHRRIVCPALPGISKTMQNSMTSPFCWVITLLPVLWAIRFPMDTTMLQLGFGLAIFGYAALYARLTQFRWCFSALTLRSRPLSSMALQGSKR
jgi:UDP-N-acetylmuramyl pentapeptide phosphotransferase/UDP-N-acetylglucosamine-1-phosphate transferase